jgi:hypothetical protein
MVCWSVISKISTVFGQRIDPERNSGEARSASASSSRCGHTVCPTVAGDCCPNRLVARAFPHREAKTLYG